jgi:hypothetical protein
MEWNGKILKKTSLSMSSHNILIDQLMILSMSHIYNTKFFFLTKFMTLSY